MSKEENYIPGIYRYCDRWCEKCAFIYRCEQYRPPENIDEEDENYGDLEEREEENEEFWRKLNEILQATYDVLSDLAIKHNIDIDDIIGVEEEEVIIELDDDELEISDEHKEKMEKNPLIKLCVKFESMTSEWFDSTDELLTRKENNINSILNMEIPGISLEKDVISLNEAFDVINWYNYFIQARLRRAYYFKLNKDAENPYNEDYNGLAKIALMGTDRLIAAWTSMIDFVPETEDAILQILIVLSEIRKRAEKEFPKARGFRRPGLDR